MKTLINLNEKLEVAEQADRFCVTILGMLMTKTDATDNVKKTHLTASLSQQRNGKSEIQYSMISHDTMKGTARQEPKNTTVSPSGR